VTTSIDDLLGYEDEPAPAGRGGVGGVVKAVLLGAAVTAAIALGLRVAAIAIPVVLVAAAVYALLILRGILRAVRATAAAAAPLHRVGEESGDYAFEGGYYLSTPDAMRRAVLRWEHRLAWHADAPGTFAVQFQPFLRELTDERLRQGYGVTIAGDPVRARRVLGEPLWGLLTGEQRRAPGPRELAAAVAAVERLRASTWEGHERA
jgi:hypothetical protein